MIFVLKFLQRYQEQLFKTAANHGNGIKLPRRKRTEGHYLYVFDNLMSQGNERCNRLLANVWKEKIEIKMLNIQKIINPGGPCTSKRLPFRIVAGVWCLAAFVFVQAYNSTLFTFLVTQLNIHLLTLLTTYPKEKKFNCLLEKEVPWTLRFRQVWLSTV